MPRPCVYLQLTKGPLRVYMAFICLDGCCKCWCLLHSTRKRFADFCCIDMTLSFSLSSNDIGVDGCFHCTLRGGTRMRPLAGWICTCLLLLSGPASAWRFAVGGSVCWRAGSVAKDSAFGFAYMIVCVSLDCGACCCDVETMHLLVDPRCACLLEAQVSLFGHYMAFGCLYGCCGRWGYSKLRNIRTQADILLICAAPTWRSAIRCFLLASALSAVCVTFCAASSRASTCSLELHIMFGSVRQASTCSVCLLWCF